MVRAPSAVWLTVAAWLAGSLIELPPEAHDHDHGHDHGHGHGHYSKQAVTLVDLKLHA